MNKLCNYHLHCEYSDDSTYKMEEVVKDAISLSLSEICFTDHVDYGIKIDHDDYTHKSLRLNDDGSNLYNVDYPKYFKEIEYLQAKYKDQIIIKKGLEFGIQTITINEFQKIYDTYPMDFVILSIHQIDNVEPWFDSPFYKVNRVENYRKYFEEYLKTMDMFRDYSVLGHLDYVLRYDFSFLPLNYYEDLVDEILHKCIKENKGIELNMASMAKYDDMYNNPYYTMLKKYHDFGGTIITIGNDSHTKGDVAKNLDKAFDILKSLGFKQYCTYENMQAIFHEI